MEAVRQEIRRLKSYIDNHRNKKHPDFAEIQRCCNQIAHKYRFLGDFERAQKWHQREVEACYEVKDKRSLSEALGNLADVIFRQGDFTTAVYWQNHRLEIIKSIKPGPEQHIEYQRAHHALGHFHLSNSEELDEQGYVSKATALRGRALEHAHKSLRYASKLEDDNIRESDNRTVSEHGKQKMQIHTYVNLGQCHYLNGDFKNSFSHLNEAKKLAVQIKDALELSPVLLNLSEAYKSSHQYDEAKKPLLDNIQSLKSGIDAITKSSKSRDEKAESLQRIKEQLFQTHYELCKMYLSKKELDLARAQLKEGKKYMSAVMNSEASEEWHSCQEHLHFYERRKLRVTRLRKSISDMESSGASAKGSVENIKPLKQMIESLEDLEMFDDMMTYSKKLLRTAEDNNDKEAQSTAYASLARGLGKKKNFEAAMEAQKRSLAICKEIHDVHGQAIAHIEIGSLLDDIAEDKYGPIPATPMSTAKRVSGNTDPSPSTSKEGPKGPSNAELPKEARELLLRAVESYRSARECVAPFSDSSFDDPTRRTYLGDSIVALQNLSLVLYKLGDIKQAEEAVAKALTLQDSRDVLPESPEDASSEEGEREGSKTIPSTKGTQRGQSNVSFTQPTRTRLVLSDDETMHSSDERMLSFSQDGNMEPEAQRLDSQSADEDEWGSRPRNTRKETSDLGRTRFLMNSSESFGSPPSKFDGRDSKRRRTMSSARGRRSPISRSLEARRRLRGGRMGVRSSEGRSREGGVTRNLNPSGAIGGQRRSDTAATVANTNGSEVRGPKVRRPLSAAYEVDDAAEVPYRCSSPFHATVDTAEDLAPLQSQAAIISAVSHLPAPQFVNVEIKIHTSRVVRVPISAHTKVRDVVDEASRKHASVSKGIRPVIRQILHEGAILDPDDPIASIVPLGATVTAEIVGSECDHPLARWQKASGGRGRAVVAERLRDMRKNDSGEYAVDFSSADLSDEDVVYALAAIEQNEHIVSLDLSRNRLSGRVCRALCDTALSLPRLKTLNLSHNMFPPTSGEWLSSLVARCSSLEVFDCSDNQLLCAEFGTPEILEVLLSRFLSAPSLRTLRLARCGLCGGTTDAPSSSQKRRPLHAKLEELDVSGNPLGPSGVSIVAHVLSGLRCPHIFSTFRSNSVSIGTQDGCEEWAGLLFQWIRLGHVRCIDLSGNAGVGSATFWHGMAAAVSARVSNGCCDPLEIALNRTCLQHDALFEIAKVISFAPLVSLLSLDHNPLGPTGGAALATAIEATTTPHTAPIPHANPSDSFSTSPFRSSYELSHVSHVRSSEVTTGPSGCRDGQHTTAPSEGQRHLLLSLRWCGLQLESVQRMERTLGSTGVITNLRTT
eukprot:Rmarinus@m.29053